MLNFKELLSPATTRKPPKLAPKGKKSARLTFDAESQSRYTRDVSRNAISAPFDPIGIVSVATACSIHSPPFPRCHFVVWHNMWVVSAHLYTEKEYWNPRCVQHRGVNVILFAMRTLHLLGLLQRLPTCSVRIRIRKHCLSCLQMFYQDRPVSSLDQHHQSRERQVKKFSQARSFRA
jgi:hypothetical protein